jgi:hypothetical protein
METAMSTPPARLLSDPQPGQPVPDFTKVVLDNLVPIAVVVGAAYLAFTGWLEEAERKAQRGHLRRERLAAYRVRHQWKASDVRPLLSIGVPEGVQRRLAGLKGRGRPVVRWHRPLEAVLSENLTHWLNLFHEDATPAERRRSIRAWPWWKHHVEALYRGELALARDKRLKSPHDCAERTVADALWMSQGALHAICVEIRAMRRVDAGSANFPPMTVLEYERWMEHGELPERLATES